MIDNLLRLTHELRDYIEDAPLKDIFKYIRITDENITDRLRRSINLIKDKDVTKELINIEDKIYCDLVSVDSIKYLERLRTNLDTLVFICNYASYNVPLNREGGEIYQRMKMLEKNFRCMKKVIKKMISSPSSVCWNYC